MEGEIMAEGFSINELVAFLLSEIVRLNVHSELSMALLREKGLISEYEARYEETLKSTIDGMIAKFPFLQPFFQELQARLSEEKVEKESKPTPDPSQEGSEEEKLEAVHEVTARSQKEEK
ncbi:MAG: hypothetical protein ACE5PV_13765 [Candidatus Poribacteria bacterium]